MAGGVSVPVHVELLGVEVGHWCRPCALSTGMRVWYVTRTLGQMSLRSKTGCMEQDHNDVELTEHPSTIWQT